MDKPGPRPRLDDQAPVPGRPDQRPLIIERSDLAHPVRRVVAFVLTLAAWFGLIAMCVPVLSLLAGMLGLPFAQGASSRSDGVVALQGLLDEFPLAVSLVLLVLAVNGVLSWVSRRISAPVTHRYVGMEQLAVGMALDPKALAEWQSGRILHVEHGPAGRVVSAQVIR